MPSPQGRYWLLTIPHEHFTPYLPPGLSYLKGQLEHGSDTGFLHWQLLALFSTAVRLPVVRRVFGPFHAELSRSSAADAYVWKDDTAVDGTRFELGTKPLKRNSKRDWDRVFDLARSGNLMDIERSVLVPHYRTLRCIAADFACPTPMLREVFVFWGPTGTGKSRLAWERAGLEAFPKDPRTKFWDGYRGQEHVVIDEFRGGIDIAHILRWLDRYPCNVEVKGSSVPLKATKIWFTSNLDPRQWYPDLDTETYAALMRRINITHFDSL